MSTDATIHLHLVLDRLREAQSIQSRQLAEVLRRLKALERSVSTSQEKSASTPLLKWTHLLRPVATSAGQWAGGVLAMAYVLKGGDLVTALQTLLKLLS